MNVTIFLVLLSCCSVGTSILTEVEKQFTQSKKASLLAMITGLVVGLAVVIVYMLLSKSPLNVDNCVYSVLIILGSGCGAMIGYDTIGNAIKQCIKFIKGE